MPASSVRRPTLIRFLSPNRKKRKNISNAQTTAAQILDIAESAAKTVPVVGNVVEGVLACAKKTLIIAETIKVCREECIDLARRADSIASSLSTDLAKRTASYDVQEEPLIAFLRVLKEIETFMRQLSQASVMARFLDQAMIKEELRRHREKLSDAATVFIIRAELHHEDLMREIIDLQRTGFEDLRSQLNPLVSSIDVVKTSQARFIQEYRSDVKHLFDSDTQTLYSMSQVCAEVQKTRDSVDFHARLNLVLFA